MRKNILDTIYRNVSKGVALGIAHLYTEDRFYDKTTITFNDQRHVNFGSYSYLGLEQDARLKEGAIDAIRRYGIQYPSSRTYVSSTLYKELEELLAALFEGPVVMATSTTLAHVAVMPIVVEEGDVIIIDQQVHTSVQFMVYHLQLQGVPFHVVRHNMIKSLEEKVAELSTRYKRVWYMADGVYSMYGDVAPMEGIKDLLARYDKLHVYMDDAHGMSWTGKHGAGYVLSKMALHERMILVTSLNKAFGAGGALAIIPDEGLCAYTKTCGGPFIFAGQHQNAALGAGIACAKIHLSPEIVTLQQALKDRIDYCQSELERHGLPLVSNGVSPIFFVALGLSRVGFSLVKRMLEAGYYMNLSIFPAVPQTCTGIRFTLTCAISFEQIRAMVAELARQFEAVLASEQYSLSDIQKAFSRIPTFTLKHHDTTPRPTVAQAYRLVHHTTITAIDEQLWDSLALGALDWKGLKELEGLASADPAPHEQWKFHYYMISDRSGKPLMATYFTLCLAKDDAIAPAQVSYEVEQVRAKEPYYLCSTTLMMGCPLSIGEHLYVDTSQKEWKALLTFFIRSITQAQQELQANVVLLRGISANTQVYEFLQDQGFVRLNAPADHIIRLLPFKDPQGYLSQLKGSYRYFARRRAIAKQSLFEVCFYDHTDQDKIEVLYALYKNVHDKSYALNVFAYPIAVVELALQIPQWDVMALHIKGHKGPVAMALSYKGKEAYSFVVAGLDYSIDEAYDVYSQLLWQVVQRANALGYTQVNMGLTTSQHKRKFGAQPVYEQVFVQTKDPFNAAIVAAMESTHALQRHKSQALEVSNNKPGDQGEERHAIPIRPSAE